GSLSFFPTRRSSDLPHIGETAEFQSLEEIECGSFLAWLHFNFVQTNRKSLFGRYTDEETEHLTKANKILNAILSSSSDTALRKLDRKSTRLNSSHVK